MNEPDRLRRILRDLDVAYSERTLAFPDEPEPWITFVIECASGHSEALSWMGEWRCDDHGINYGGWDRYATISELLLERVEVQRRVGCREDHGLLLRVLNAALRWEEPDAD